MTRTEAAERYERAVAEWVWQPPDTVDAALAMVEFAGVLAADKLVGEALREGGPVSDETDALHQTVALSAVRDWLQKIATAKWLERRRAAYGPSGMPRNGGQP